MFGLLFALLDFEYIQIEFIVGSVLGGRRTEWPLLLVLEELTNFDAVIRGIRLFRLGSVALTNHLNAIR